MESEAKMGDIAKKFGVEPTFLYRIARINKVPYKVLLNRINREVRLFPVDWFENFFKEYNQIPMIKDLSEEIRLKFLPLETIANKLGIDSRTIERQLIVSEVSTLKMRTSNGNLRVCYNIEEIEEVVSKVLSLPKVSKKKRVYIDSEGHQFLSSSFFQKKYDLSKETVKHHLTNVRKVLIRGSRAEGVYLYSETDAQKVFSKIAELPRADTKAGICFYNNESWVDQSYITKRFNLSDQLTAKYFKTAKKINGRNRLGRESRLYNLNEVENFIKTLPPKAAKNRILTYKDQEWATLSFLAELTGIEAQSLAKRLKKINIQPVRARDSFDRLTDFYPILESRVIAQELTSQPIINDEGLFVDNSGERWAAGVYLRKRFKLDSLKTSKILAHGRIESIRGRARNGNNILLFNLTQFEEIKLQAANHSPNYTAQLRELIGV